MIIEEIDESLFISRFEDYKRVETPENPNGNFSYKGLRALFQYLDSLSEDTGEDIKLDVISLCCDYAEYRDLEEYLKDNYTEKEINEKLEDHKQDTEEATQEAFKIWVEAEISDNTTLIKFSDDLNDGFIIQGY